MALPIFAKYMTSVYADPSLGITQNDQFDVPAGFDPCHNDDDMLAVSDEEEGYVEEELTGNNLEE